MKSKRPRIVLIVAESLLWSAALFFVFGMITRLIPNDFFARMTPTSTLDYAYLVLTSLLLGTFVTLVRHGRKSNAKCAVAAYGGGAVGVLGFACSVCNQLLVLLLGVGGVLAFFEPYRPVIGAIGIILMFIAVYVQARMLFAPKTARSNRA